MSAPTPPTGGSTAGARVRLGELLVQAGVLSAEKLQEALRIQAAEGSKRRLGRLLVEQGFVDETLLTQLLGRQLSVPWVSLYHVDFSRQLLNLVPREVAEGYGLVPVYVRHVRGQGETLYVATDDPTNEEGMKRAAAYAGLPVRPMIASASDIRSAIRAYYGGGKPEPTASAVAPPAAARVEQVEPARIPEPPPTTKVDVPKPQKPADLPKSAKQRAKSERPPAQSPAAKPAAEAPAAPAAPVPAPAEPTKSNPVPSAEAPAPSKPRLSPSPSVIAALAAAALAPPKIVMPVPDDGPEIEAHEIPPPPKARTKRAIALTFLDGTTIRLPAPRARKNVETETPEAKPGSQDDEQQLTARDMIAALRAVAQGAPASEVLGENPRWEAMFAALLSLMLKKHQIADWEFVEEFKKMRGDV